jgi:AraC-like DNA-binding protein
MIDDIETDQDDAASCWISGWFSVSVGLSVPRHVLAPLLKTPDEHNMRILSGRNPLVALLHSHLKALFEQMPAMSLAQARAVVAPTVQLLAAAMNGTVTEEAADSIRQEQTEQIRRYIDTHLLNPGLTVESISAAFGMSVRKLHRLFEPYGGVIAYAQRQRLYRIHAAITDPARKGRSIQDIAEDHGFRHRKNFVTAFRQAFDMTPREARAHAQQERQAASVRPRFVHRWEWYRAS